MDTIMKDKNKKKDQLIEELDEARKRIVENEVRLRTLVQTIPDLIWLKDASGIYLFCNPTFERLYGAKETEIVGKTDYDFVDRELADSFREHDLKAITAGKPSANEEWLTFADDGYRGLFDTVKTPMYDTKGKLIGVLGIARDITAHKQAQDESQLLAQRIKFATDAASIGIWDWDLKADHWYATPTYFTMLGYEPDEGFSNREKWMKLLHPEDRDRVDEKIRAVLDGRDEPYQYEARMLHADGSYRWINVVGRILTQDEQGKVIRMLGVRIDVTERKMAEEALRETEERFRLAFNTSPDSININRLEDGLYVDINEGFTALTGYTRQDVIGKTSVEINIWHNPADRKELVQGLTAKGIYENLEAQFIRKDGSITTALMSARIIKLQGVSHIISITRDISMRKNAEEALRISQQEYRNLFENAVVGMFRSRIDGSSILKANQALCDLLGYTREEMLSEPATILWAEQEAREKMVKLLNKDGTVTNFEADFVTKSGGIRQCLLSVKLYPAEGYMEGTIIDITEHKQAEEERKARSRFFESMDKVNRAIQGSNNLDQVMSNVLDTLLSIFDCDRAWLLYPCDPDAPSFRVPMEISRPEYPGAKILNVDIPMSPGEAQNMREALESDDPVTYTAGTERPISTAKQFGVQSQMFFPLYPKLGKPWVFGMHQCSYPRIWTAAEKKLFQEIGRRLADVLSSLLAYRELRESEELYRSLFENMLNGFAYCRMLFDQGHPKDFIYLDVNSAFEKLTGLNDVVGKKVSEVIPGIQQSDPELFETYGRVASTGNPEKFELYVEALKQWFSVSVYSPEKEHFVAVFDVITERKLAEEALERRIVMLTKPLEDTGSIAFEDLFNIDEIQHLQDEFAKATGVASIITHTDGTPITKASNFCRLCNEIIRKTELGLKNCYQSDAYIGQHHPEGPIVRPCLSGGLWDAGASITVGGRHIANWLIGQVRNEAQSEDTMLTYSREIGVDEQTFMEAFREVPTMSRERFDEISQSLFTLANQLSKSAYQNILQARFITERKHVEERLKNQMEFVSTLLDTIPSPVFYKDVSGRYLGCNKAFEDFWGRPRESIIGKLVHDMGPVEIAEKYEAMDQGLFEQGGHQTYEWQVRAADGSEKDVIFNKATFKDASGNTAGLVGVILDITERKRTEEALRESEEKYRLITDNITDIILTTDISGTYTFISSSHKRVLARGEEVLGTSIFEYIHPEDLAGVIATFDNAVKSRGIARAEYRYLHPSRGNIWLESEGMLIDIQGTLTGVVVSRDITARKHADEDLRESEERFRQLFESMVTGFALHEIICDEGGAPQDYKFLKVNPAFEQLTGLKSEDIVGRTIREVLPDTEQYWIDLYGQVALTGNPIHFENFTEALNKYFEVSAYSPKHGQFAAVFLDITARKRAEEELQKQHELLTQLVGTSPVGITFVDASGKIIFANTRAEEILGLSKTDITRLEYNALAWRITDLDGNPFPMENLPFMQVLKTKKPVKDIQHAIEWPDGHRILLSINGAPLISATNEFGGMVATFEDITERKLLEIERLKLEERLQQSYKMEAIGSLAGGIAHDFNNILSAVFGFAELAKMKLENKGEIENELDEILKAGVRARDLVKQILTFSRQAGIKREPMVLVPLIKETMKFLRASLPVTIAISQDFPVSDSMIIADPTQIHQVIMNLCTNAAHAMKEKGGRLDVRLAEVELDDTAELDYKGLKRGRYLRLSVTDTGSGIPKEVIKRIFDPFFTTKERGEGTGMGLSVVHGIVKDMGGAISVYSDPGIGTTFNILFPLYKGETVETSALNTLMKTGSGRILFVDDEEGVIVSGRGILEQLGYAITATTSPMEALDLFTSDPGAFDLVLTDLTMPRMTGLELSERLLEIRPHIPIVLCTGFSLGISPERIRDAGIREMVMKPMVASELSEAVYKALNPAGG